MKRVMWVLLLVLFCGGMAFAAQPVDEPETVSQVEMNLRTYAGVAGIVVFLLGLAKHFFPTFIKGKEKLGAVVLNIAVGALSKALNVGFVEVDWILHIVTLASANAIGSGLIHDKLTNPLLEFIGSLGKKSAKVSGEG